MLLVGSAGSGLSPSAEKPDPKAKKLSPKPEKPENLQKPEKSPKSAEKPEIWDFQIPPKFSKISYFSDIFCCYFLGFSSVNPYKISNVALIFSKVPEF